MDRDDGDTESFKSTAIAATDRIPIFKSSYSITNMNDYSIVNCSNSSSISTTAAASVKATTLAPTKCISTATYAITSKYNRLQFYSRHSKGRCTKLAPPTVSCFIECESVKEQGLRESKQYELEG